MFITCRCFGCCCTVQHSACLCMGMGKKLEGDTAGTADPNWPKEYIYYSTVSHSAIKTGGRQRRRYILTSKEAIALIPAGH